MNPLLPIATARGALLARFAAWHAETGRRFDGVVRWAIGLACAMAIAHAALFAVAFALVMWRHPMPLAPQAVYSVFWMVVAAIAAGVQLALTFAVVLPIGWATRGVGGRLVSGLVAAALLVGLEGRAGYLWIVLAPAHRVPVEAMTALAAAVGLLWGSWLPAACALRSDRA